MDKNIKICTIGGGSGMPIVNKALIKAGYKNISSVVTTFDSGGDTGRIRTDERGNVLAFSDYWRSLMSLWVDGDKKESWENMLKYRDGRGRNFGNVFFQFMSEKVGNLSKVDNLFCSLTGAVLNGKVVPVSEEPSEICFLTKSGKEYCGEHILDDLRMSKDAIDKIWINPVISGNKEAIEVLKDADLIIFCPGSMYGSVLANLLPLGVKEAVVCSKAKKILMTNIMSVANENNGFSQVEYVNVFEKYLESTNVFDLVLMPDYSKLDKAKFEEVKRNYDMEYAYPIEHKSTIDDKAVLVDIAIIDEVNYRIRHSEEKMAVYFECLNL